MLLIIAFAAVWSLPSSLIMATMIWVLFSARYVSSSPSTLSTEVSEGLAMVAVRLKLLTELSPVGDK